MDASHGDGRLGVDPGVHEHPGAGHGYDDVTDHASRPCPESPQMLGGLLAGADPRRPLPQYVTVPAGHLRGEVGVSVGNVQVRQAGLAGHGDDVARELAVGAQVDTVVGIGIDHAVISTQNESLELNEQTAEESQLQTLISTIEKLEQDVKEAKESAARANAESYNAQRRMERETDKAKKFALQKFAKELLDVVDNLERAIANITDDAAKEGVELTHKSLLGVLEKNGVVAVGQVGHPFNPDVHEAVGIFPDAEKDVIGQVLQKGYTLNERTLRPAMVMVGA